MQHTDLNDDERTRFMRTCTFVGIKLASVWEHKDAFERIEDELVERARSLPPPKHPIVAEVLASQRLFRELDECLVQVKSTLDVLVKVPAPIVGAGRWNLPRFGEHGELLARALEHNLPRKHAPLVPAMKKALVDDHKDWLAITITLRDTLNHYLNGNLKIEDFSVYVIGSGARETVHRTMWSPSQTVREALQVVWSNLFLYVENFVAFFLNLRRNEAMGFLKTVRPIDDPAPAWTAVLDPEIAASLQRAIDRGPDA